MSTARKASRAGMGVGKLWLTDMGTVPVLVCAGLATVAGTLTALRTISKSPDYFVDKTRRGEMLAHQSEQGSEWRAPRFRYANLVRNPINQSRQFDDLFAKDENKDVKR
ncbi:hypothetical protein Poli38472_004689 [Pythium oligandrum]|uniref:Uncharacterized protein n=1 Tax=Pythium oligandrum TaxID=41045 RepID=A0A8K1CAP8_PYTOL|nr:hypothetical protein Poli38472_004689 [Pythium oligandrum]|eukprot:TMW59620.1 hypothetical protein Poli38472_004689 [Pythium oligandrum]